MLFPYFGFLSLYGANCLCDYVLNFVTWYVRTFKSWSQSTLQTHLQRLINTANVLPTQNKPASQKPFYLLPFGVFEWACDLFCQKNLPHPSRSSSNVPSSMRTSPTLGTRPNLWTSFSVHILLCTNHILSPGKITLDKSRNSYYSHEFHSWIKETDIMR